MRTAGQAAHLGRLRRLGMDHGGTAGVAELDGVHRAALETAADLSHRAGADCLQPVQHLGVRPPVVVAEEDRAVALAAARRQRQVQVQGVGQVRHAVDVAGRDLAPLAPACRTWKLADCSPQVAFAVGVQAQPHAAPARQLVAHPHAHVVAHAAEAMRTRLHSPDPPRSGAAPAPESCSRWRPRSRRPATPPRRRKRRPGRRASRAPTADRNPPARAQPQPFRLPPPSSLRPRRPPRGQCPATPPG